MARLLRDVMAAGAQASPLHDKQKEMILSGGNATTSDATIATRHDVSHVLGTASRFATHPLSSILLSLSPVRHYVRPVHDLYLRLYGTGLCTMR